jgi:hypothetical protein
MRKYRLSLVVAVCAFVTIAVQSYAATFRCPSGNVACLIAAIHSANGTPEPDTIQLAAGMYTLTSADSSGRGLPPITSPVTIQGNGATVTVLERAEGAPRFFILFAVMPTGSLTVEGLTLRRGDPGILSSGGAVTVHDSILEGHTTPAFDGAAIAAHGGTVTIRRSTLRDNWAWGGAAIFADRATATIDQSSIIGNAGADGWAVWNRQGILTLSNSTLAQNAGGLFGAALNSSGEAHLVNVTITDNDSCELGGCANRGAVTANGLMTLSNSVIAGNRMGSPQFGPDCAGTVTSRGHNLIGDLTGCTIALHPTDLVGDPVLDAYTDDDLPGHGHYPPLPDSPLINAGNDTACPATDQLGNPRAGPCDIGAVELQSPSQPPSLALHLNQLVYRTPGDTLRVDVTLRNPGPMRTTDVYFGVILPDGDTVLWLTSTAPIAAVAGSLRDSPATFTPLFRGASWPANLDVTHRDVLVRTYDGQEMLGVYHLLMAWVQPNSLADGRLDEGDVLALAWQGLWLQGGAPQVASR